MSVSSSVHRPRSRLLAAWAMLLAAPIGLGACDEEVVVRNAPPDVRIEGWCTDGPRTYLVITAFDLESDPVDLSVCAVAGPAMGTGPTGDGLFGLTSEPEGRWHLIEWAAADGECACPRDPETSGGCLPPPTGEAAPTVELLVGDTDNALVPQDEQQAEPLGACP